LLAFGGHENGYSVIGDLKTLKAGTERAKTALRAFCPADDGA
jgi:hypothetical protein